MKQKTVRQSTIQTSLVSQKRQAPELGHTKAVIVSITIEAEQLPSQFDEFYDLVQATGAEIVAVVQGRRSTISVNHFVGVGKLEEMADLVSLHQADLVIFNHHLTPSQERNIGLRVQARVLDRTGLILDIFAQRAQTFEGKLQVELAQLEHLATKLVRGWTHLERQKGGIGLRGPGETQLETDRRLISQRIKAIKKRLAKVAQQRRQSRRSRKRSQVRTIALVGYTNAGKSSWFNRLTSADVQVKDQLFATLDPTVRQLGLPGAGQAVLADTVGFVRNLPHGLVAAFRATLEEVVDADLLVHVVDGASDERHDLITAVNDVLAEIDADQVPQLIVYNKCDLLADVKPRIDYNEHHLPVRVWVSVHDNECKQLMVEAIAMALDGELVECEIIVPFEQSKLMANLYDQDVVLNQQALEAGWLVLVKMPLHEFKSQKLGHFQRKSP